MQVAGHFHRPSCPPSRYSNSAVRSKLIPCPRDGAIIFGDLLSKLDALEVACDKCGRKGRYAVARLIEQRGHDAKVVDLLAELKADCPKQQAGI
jgi:hypothetical protein